MESHNPIMNDLIVLVSIALWSTDSWLPLSLICHEIGSLQRSPWLSWGEIAVRQPRFGLVGALIEYEAFSVARIISSSCQLSTGFHSLGSGRFPRFSDWILVACCCGFQLCSIDFSGRSSLAFVYSFGCIPDKAYFEFRESIMSSLFFS